VCGRKDDCDVCDLQAVLLGSDVKDGIENLSLRHNNVLSLRHFMSALILLTVVLMSLSTLLSAMALITAAKKGMGQIQSWATRAMKRKSDEALNASSLQFLCQR
jgi:hypothetical protein